MYGKPTSFIYINSIYVWYAIHFSHLYVPCSRPLVHLEISLSYCTISLYYLFLYPRSPKGEGGILFYLCPSVQDIFRCIFLSNCWWQKSDIWSQASYRYTILWVAFLDPSDSYFLFARLSWVFFFFV